MNGSCCYDFGVHRTNSAWQKYTLRMEGKRRVLEGCVETEKEA